VPGAAFLTDEWIQECNEALATLPRSTTPDVAARPMAVTESVTGVPAGTHGTITLLADASGVRMVAGEEPGASAWFTLAYDDAEAMHAGLLDPATALTEGRIRVRGDLQALVSAVGMLAAAHEQLRAR
jgi:hypothetical protein